MVKGKSGKITKFRILTLKLVLQNIFLYRQKLLSFLAPNFIEFDGQNAKFCHTRFFLSFLKLPITSVFDVNLIPKPLKRDFSRFGHVIIDP